MSFDPSKVFNPAALFPPTVIDLETGITHVPDDGGGTDLALKTCTPTITHSLKQHPSEDVYALRIFNVGISSQTNLLAVVCTNAVHWLDIWPDAIHDMQTNRNCHDGVITCAAMIPDTSGIGRIAQVLTGGSDGKVKSWKYAMDTPTMTYNLPKGETVSAISCSNKSGLFAVGTENPEESPADTPIYFFRFSASPIRAFLESHSDTITHLELHPYDQDVLISASMDGTIQVFNLEVSAEEDAVESCVNNEGPVKELILQDFALRGQIGDGDRELNKNFAVAAMTSDDRMRTHSLREVIGGIGLMKGVASSKPIDLRGFLNCDYAIGVRRQSGTPDMLAVATINTELPRVDLLFKTTLPELFTVQDQDDPEDIVSELDPEIHIKPGGWQLIVRLYGAHGNDVVRDVWFRNATKGLSSLVVTVGEDAMVKVWTDGMQLHQAELAGELFMNSTHKGSYQDLFRSKGKERERPTTQTNRRYAPY